MTTFSILFYSYLLHRSSIHMRQILRNKTAFLIGSVTGFACIQLSRTQNTESNTEENLECRLKTDFHYREWGREGDPFRANKPREYWTIYRGPGFLIVTGFGSIPTLFPPLPSVSSTKKDWERETTCPRKGGGSQIIWRLESLVLFKSFVIHTIERVYWIAERNSSSWLLLGLELLLSPPTTPPILPPLLWISQLGTDVGNPNILVQLCTLYSVHP